MHFFAFYKQMWKENKYEFKLGIKIYYYNSANNNCNCNYCCYINRN